MEDDNLIQNALEQLKAHTGIEAELKKVRDPGIDGTIRFNINGKTHVMYIEVKRQLRAHQVMNLAKLKKQYDPLLVIAENIYPKLKEELRRENIAYLETNGNVYLKDKDIFLWLEGHKAGNEPKEKTGRAFGKTGLKLVFHFLLEPELVNLTYREMAARTGIVFGNINVIINDLKQQGFLLPLDKQHYKLNNKKKLLQRWMVAYEERLKPTIRVGNFRFLKEEDYTNWKRLPLVPMKTWWGAEPAADLFTNYLKPGELTLYTKETRQELIKHYRLIPDENGNVKVFQKFWNYDEVNDNVVPPLLVYVDLMNTNDRRCIETAEKIYEQFLQDKF